MNDFLTASELNEVGTIPDSLLGTIKEFEATDLSAVGPNRGRLHGRKIVAMAVKNESGGTLSAGQIVLHSTSTEGVGEGVGAATSAAAVAEGVVPWCITGTIADDANFWLIKKGYCKFLSDGGNDVAAGALVQPAASGRVSAHTAGTNDIYCCGKMIEAIGAVADAKVAGIADFKF